MCPFLKTDLKKYAISNLYYDNSDLNDIKILDKFALIQHLKSSLKSKIINRFMMHFAFPLNSCRIANKIN